MGSKLKKEDEHDETSRVFQSSYPLIIIILKFGCLPAYHGKPFESDDTENMCVFYAHASSPKNKH